MLKTTMYKPGQRWVSSAEPEAGLGIVAGIDGRNLEVSFPAIGETRLYSVENAPLSRIQYREGESVYTAEGVKLSVVDVTDQAGRYFYLCEDEHGEKVVVDELDLDSFVHFSSPRDRLLSGQIDSVSRYKLRRLALDCQRQLHQIKTPGLLGARVQLLPHQFFIASEVASRHAPRVLLADEVGLGKTIEAGLILHQQLVTGRAGRVLVIVPESLIHQWLVEMLRRFNLMFSILDEEACLDLESSSGSNPFEQAQLVLCSLQFIVDNPDRAQQALDARWDVMVVDEAHHLSWHDGEPGMEYQCVEMLASEIPGVILLTATPEQLGLEGHFARLKLLDPDRYHSLDLFREEENSYQHVRQLVEKLMAVDAIDQLQSDQALVDELQSYLGLDASNRLQRALESDLNEGDYERALDDVIRSLVDRHGTGRVLFRNTRDAVAGFPSRVFNPHPLPVPAAYSNVRGASVASLLRPEEVLGESWLSEDPRVVWLIDWLSGLRDAQGKLERALVICANAETAADLEALLSLRKGIRATAFHEGMSLLQRDRAAAYFADEEESAQVLICSEIGSEGRNFQFVRHLVLFDLPLNPDLLEQRIGRLDRIGQKHDIQLHVPFYESGAQQALVNWYQQGLNAFERVCPVGGVVFAEVENELLDVLAGDADDLPALVAKTTQLTEKALDALRDGRDRLLELSSCHPYKAQGIIDGVRAAEDPLILSAFMEKVFDQFGVDHSYHSPDALVLHPGDHMHCESFPGLLEEGMTVTYSREKALSREDMHFLSWEHPMVKGVMEMILGGDFGNVSLCSLKLPPMKPGSLLLETVFTLHCPAPRELQLHRFLPLTSRRIVLDMKGNNLSGVLAPEHLDKLGRKVDMPTAQKLVKHASKEITALIDQSEQLVATSSVSGSGETMIESAIKKMERTQQQELERLESLAAVNPNIRGEEIDYIRKNTDDLREAIGKASWRLEALRVAITM